MGLLLLLSADNHRVMALSLDDRILGEKVDNYCSSDEGEREDEEQGDNHIAEPKQSSISEPRLNDYNGFSTNVS
jgi:hypothetical protein